MNIEEDEKILKILMTKTDLELLVNRGIKIGIFEIEIKKE